MIVSARTTVIIAAAAVVVAVLWIAGRHAAGVIDVASAFYAKTLCSGVFVAGRDPEAVVDRDILADMADGYRHFDGAIDREQGLVTASLFGFAERRALYRPGLGCTLVTGTTVEGLLAQAAGYTPPALPDRPDALWPQGDRVELGAPAGVGAGELEAALDAAFAEPRPEALRRTRAVVVVHKGRIIAERYAPGFGPDTPQLGWSMGKTAVNALVGVLAGRGALATDRDTLYPQWRDDARAGITVEHLLRMTSGLDFDEPNARMLSDVRVMLFRTGDSVAYAASEQPARPPGDSWFYAGGSTTLLCGLMREAVSGGAARHFTFPRTALFEPIGMASAVLEPDAAGTFLGPAFMYATARDWARLGLLYLNGGVWEGERILPEGWVEYSLRPAPHSDGRYGAHLWLDVPDFLRPRNARDRPVPEDAFFMLGHDGQMVAMVPSRELVVVRLGLSRRRSAWDPETFMHEILKAFPARSD